MTKLEPCPFCGGTLLQTCETPCSWHESGFAYAVTCRTRDCHGAIFSLGYDLFKTPEEALAAWNRRTPPASQSDERENDLPRCDECGAPAGLDCRTIQGRTQPHSCRLEASQSDEALVAILGGALRPYVANTTNARVAAARAVLPVIKRERAAARREGVKEADKAVWDAGGDNTEWHSNAIRALGEKQP